MQKKFLLTYFFIFAIILIMMSLSRHTSDKMRGHSVAFIAPLWKKALTFKTFLLDPSQPSPFSHLSIKEDQQRLQLENQLLEIEVAYLHKLLEEQLSISSQIAQIALFKDEALSLTATYQKSLQNNLQLLQHRAQAIPARVIFRSFDTWNSFLWINVGESTNQNYPTRVVALYSPVILGKAIIGIIDYVGENQSRIRLLSDSRLHLSVRAARGGEQESLMSEQIESLLQQMKQKDYSFLSQEEQGHLFQLLQTLRHNLQPLKKTWHLAKGELLGSPFSARLGQNIYLTGTGFNYDFSDEEGSPRDLRHGKALQQSNTEAISILKVNDVLVTTGMDGIFPPGFQAAVVTRVGVLKEGDYFYDLEAKPIAGALEELSLVFVLSPLIEEKEEFLRNK